MQEFFASDYELRGLVLLLLGIDSLDNDVQKGAQWRLAAKPTQKN